MTLSVEDWHARFTEQALWTRSLREYLLQELNAESAESVFEVGCGTGAVLGELKGGLSSSINVFGLDINANHLRFASQVAPEVKLTQGDAHWLPYDRESFDISLCHYLLLWVLDPVQVFREMMRVTRKGGTVIAFAEPDYGGRLDYPYDLEKIGKWQSESLRRQGADPLVGRRLAHILLQAGLKRVHSGLLGGQWTFPSPSINQPSSEWDIIEADLQFLPDVDDHEIKRLKALDATAREKGARILYVPTFYAWGIK